jgi:hypothetical protein
MLVAAVRAGLSILPFATLRRLVARLMVPMRGVAREHGVVDRIAWAVPAASRYVPRATCLTQALSAQVLLARRGYPAELRIGVARDSHGAFNAHAWVEHDGRIIVGELGYEEFTPLPTFDVRDR